MLTGMTSYRRALFDIDVMARLRFPMPEDPDLVSDEEVEAVWENRRSFVEQYRELLEQRLDELMTDGYDIDDCSRSARRGAGLGG